MDEVVESEFLNLLSRFVIRRKYIRISLMILKSALSPIGDHRREYNDKRRKAHKNGTEFDQSLERTTKMKENIVLGMNNVTKVLERGINHTKTKNKTVDSHGRLAAVIVFYYDIISPRLIPRHLPSLCHYYDNDVMLIPLRKGNEVRISKCLAMKRIMCMGLKVRTIDII